MAEDEQPSREAANVIQPAPNGHRVVAWLLDVLIACAVSASAAMIAWGMAGWCRGRGCDFVLVLGLGCGIALLLIVQLVLIAWRGQSVGMRITGLRVCRIDGSPAGFVRGVVLRYLPLLLVPATLFGVFELIWSVATAGADEDSVLVRWIGYSRLSVVTSAIPVVITALYFVADAAATFLPGGRALHNRFAGTIIANARGSPGCGT